MFGDLREVKRLLGELWLGKADLFFENKLHLLILAMQKNPASSPSLANVLLEMNESCL